jgi:membrane-associated protein
MDLLKQLLEIVLHLQEHLNQLTQDYGPWVYGILFVIIFCETGLVVTPFLPGDSLLFAVGALAADPQRGLNVWIAGGLMFVAAVLGDTVNYSIGKFAGEWLVRRFPRIIKPKHLELTNEFFEKYGGKTIILARFVPIVRTFAPFVAGSGAMDYKRFMMFNVVGGFLWVALILPAGWFFGNIPIVKRNFELVVIGIIFVSVLPMVYEIWKAHRAHAKAQTHEPHRPGN